jgi:hypothetical protein
MIASFMLALSIADAQFIVAQYAFSYCSYVRSLAQVAPRTPEFCCSAFTNPRRSADCECDATHRFRCEASQLIQYPNEKYLGRRDVAVYHGDLNMTDHDDLELLRKAIFSFCRRPVCGNSKFKSTVHRARRAKIAIPQGPNIHSSMNR